jgi:hypothetical protein
LTYVGHGLWGGRGGVGANFYPYTLQHSLLDRVSQKLSNFAIATNSNDKKKTYEFFVVLIVLHILVNER